VKSNKPILIYNQFINFREVRVNFEDGESKVLNTSEALSIAEGRGLDLIVINEIASPPVCKIADKNKFLYEKKQKLKDTAKKARASTVEHKEIRMGLNIEQNDITVKSNKIKSLLEKNCRVTITVTLKGRERSKQHIARELIQSIADGIGVELELFGTSGNRVSAKIKG
jgi:translation initiation factor IF-3